MRGVQVILDRDLADFYGVIPTRLREQVKRNQNRFPEDFVFQLNSEEVLYMVSQNAIPSSQVLGGHLPYAFTEQGVAAVSAVITLLYSWFNGQFPSLFESIVKCH